MSAMTAYYKEKLEQGLSYQDFVIEKLYEHGLPLISYSSKKYQVLYGENKAGIEIKNDQKFRETGNFYIEIAEKSHAGMSKFVESGIFRNDNTWLYVIGDYEEIFVFGKKQLKIVSKNVKYKKVEISTSKGFLLPVKDARKSLALEIIDCKEHKI